MYLIIVQIEKMLKFYKEITKAKMVKYIHDHELYVCILATQ